LQRLSPEQQASFQKLWSEARAGHESPLCEKAGDAAQAPRPDCIDYAAWTAISGDHSCSARDMLTIVHDAPWIVGVARVSARLKTQLAAAQRRDQHVNAVRDSDMALQRTDPDYVTRASSYNAHFLLARPSVDIEPLAYSQLALGSNSDLNALGTYVWYHLSALRKATPLSRGADASAETHADLVRAALADEAFALHFLEDGFAAGYATGTWGNTAVRKVTHDYYSEHGLALVRGAESRLSRWATHTPGVLNESSDGLVFAEIGIREDKHASGTATLPGRGALTARFRVPFWLIPGDLVVAAPILAFTSKQTLMKMGVRAVNGGLIPWQAGIATRVGRFQFVFGREVGLAFYRNGSDHPILIPTPGVPPVNATAISLNSLQIEFPILEYRLFRTFSLNQSSGLIIQPYVGFDRPTSSSVVSPPGALKPGLNTIVIAGVRVVFDWRHYLDFK
jgi:hypothetical protein